MEQKEIVRLYELYSQDVFRMALSYLHNKQDAEDICQAVFLKMMDQKPLLIQGKEKSWLLKCTANACKNHLRSYWHRNTQELNDNMVFTDDFERELWAAMLSLSPKDRAILHLYYYERYAQSEIANILGITVSAVQNRMQRARKNLEKELTVCE